MTAKPSGGSHVSVDHRWGQPIEVVRQAVERMIKRGLDTIGRHRERRISLKCPGGNHCRRRKHRAEIIPEALRDERRILWVIAEIQPRGLWVYYQIVQPPRPSELFANDPLRLQRGRVHRMQPA